MNENPFSMSEGVNTSRQQTDAAWQERRELRCLTLFSAGDATLSRETHVLIELLNPMAAFFVSRRNRDLRLHQVSGYRRLARRLACRGWKPAG